MMQSNPSTKPDQDHMAASQRDEGPSTQDGPRTWDGPRTKAQAPRTIGLLISYLLSFLITLGWRLVGLRRCRHSSSTRT